MNFKCTCGESVEFGSNTEGSYNVGEAQTQTGWTFLPSADGGSIWLCKTCADKATPLAEELFKILGTAYAHIPSLLKNIPEE